jgi:hypothetical protein
MTPEAPLQITVEIHLQSGPAAGQRRFRLSRGLHLPPALSFDAELPVEGEGMGRLTLDLPGCGRLDQVWARLRFDPEHPERGSRAEFLDLRPEAVQSIQTFIEQWEEYA